jgi:hypothetical protein
VIVEPIVFEDGILIVQKTNPVLQQFLHYHPGNGTEFFEFDNERDAEEDVISMYSELDAQLAARDLAANDFNTLEAVARILLGGKVDQMSSAEVKRDMMIYAKRYPEDFLDAVNDPSVTFVSGVNFISSSKLLFVKYVTPGIFSFSFDILIL